MGLRITSTAEYGGTSEGQKHLRFGPFTWVGRGDGTYSTYETIVHNLNTKNLTVILGVSMGTGEYRINHPNFFETSNPSYAFRRFGYHVQILNKNTIYLTLFRSVEGSSTRNYYVDIFAREDSF